MELRLKRHYLSHPELKNAILTHRELSQYIAWLAREEFASWDGSLTQRNENFTEIAKRLNQNPMDSKTVSALTALYENQREERFLMTGYDISVGRMFRYMPAHWNTNEYFEVYYCLSGICPIHFDTEIISLTHGSVLILSPTIRHASPCYADDAVLNYYMLRSSTFEEVFWKQLPSNSLMSSFFRYALSHT